MTEQLTVRRVIDAPAASIFAALANPELQAELDGSEMLQGAIDPMPLTAVGEMFAMEMYQPAIGEYVMENTVFVFEQDRRIGWIPNRKGMEPRGTRWSWELDAVTDDRTALTQVYDWSRVTDPEFRRVAGFPRVKEEQIVDTMRKLARHLGVPIED